MFPFFAENFLLVLALCMDTFAACLSYGAQGVKVPLASMAVFSGISAGVLCLSMWAGNTAGLFLSGEAAELLGFGILFLLGLLKLFDSAVKAMIRRFPSLEKKISFSVSGLHFILNVYADPGAANGTDPAILSPAEAVTLGLALSLDSAAAGLGAGMLGRHPLFLTSLAFFMGLAAAGCGVFLGRRIASKCRLDLSFAGGILLILLAFLKLF